MIMIDNNIATKHVFVKDDVRGGLYILFHLECDIIRVPSIPPFSKIAPFSKIPHFHNVYPIFENKFLNFEITLLEVGYSSNLTENL